MWSSRGRPPCRAVHAGAGTLPAMQNTRDRPSAMHASDDSAAVRLDVWLWAARFFKTRSLAKQAIEAGRVVVDGDRAKPARAVRAGDVLAVTRGEDTFLVTVLAVSARRGAAPEARRLYDEDPLAQQARLALAAVRTAARAGYRAPEGKPDKRARRLIHALGDIDVL